MPDERSATDPFAAERAAALDPRERYELLLRAIRFLLARRVSFTSIEEVLTGGGIAPALAERVVELVIQELTGRVHVPGTYPEFEVPVAALVALGAEVREHTAVVRRDEPRPDLDFGASDAVATAAEERMRGSERGFYLALALLLCFFALAGALALAFW